MVATKSKLVSGSKKIQKRNRLHRENAQSRGGMINQGKASVVVTLHEERGW